MRYRAAVVKLTALELFFGSYRHDYAQSYESSAVPGQRGNSDALTRGGQDFRNGNENPNTGNGPNSASASLLVS